MPTRNLIEKREVEYGMLMSGGLVRQTLDRKKTVTRRLNKLWMRVKEGQHIWIRETCVKQATIPTYAADGSAIHDYDKILPWWYSKPVCPSIHMPRRVCRILLRATADATEERLQRITADEAIAEGIDRCNSSVYSICIKRFENLWDSIHGDDPDKCWKADPTVVRVPFTIEEVR